MESSPSAHRLAISINWLIVFGFKWPNSSLSSRLHRPRLKVSIALSSEMSSVAFLGLVQRWMYERIDSLAFCVHDHNSSMEAGCLKVAWKFWTKSWTRSS
jgi:hypothetical protein